MSDLSDILAKLSGIRKALVATMNENISGKRSAGLILTRSHFSPDLVRHYFTKSANYIERLRRISPNLYADFQAIVTEPEYKKPNDQHEQLHFSRAQTERLVRDIDQVFEIRANSELKRPNDSRPECVFITHGRSNDWRAVQQFIEKDVGLHTIELAQEANLGRTIIEKLCDSADRCDSAVIVMTGDDIVNEGELRVRENVMHEIGFFQGRYGRNRVILLHEDGIITPTNLAGIAYIPFPKGNIEADFHVVQRELNAIYMM